jgi:hypothetical protein
MALIAFLGLAGLVGAPLMLDRGPPAIAHASVAFPSVLVLPGLFAASGLAVSRGAGAIAAAAAIPFALFFPAPQLVEELLLVSLGAGLLLVLVGMQTSRDLVLYGVATAAFGAVPVGAFWLYGIAVAQVPALVASASWGLFLAVHTAGAANIVYPQWWSGAGRTTRLLAVTGMLLFTVSILAAGLLGGLQLVESFPSVWPAP